MNGMILGYHRMGFHDLAMFGLGGKNGTKFVYPHEIQHIDTEKNDGFLTCISFQISHTIHVWYIYPHLVGFMVNVGKCTRHGCYGYGVILDIQPLVFAGVWLD